MSEYCGWCGALVDVTIEVLGEDEPGGPIRICVPCNEQPPDAA